MLGLFCFHIHFRSSLSIYIFYNFWYSICCNIEYIIQVEGDCHLNNIEISERSVYPFICLNLLSLFQLCFILKNFFNQFFWLYWVFDALHGFSLLWQAMTTLHCGAQASNFGGLSCGAQTLGSGASLAVAARPQNTGSVVATQGLSCSAACGIFPDQRSNLCPLHYQTSSYHLHHLGTPVLHLIDTRIKD